MGDYTTIPAKATLKPRKLVVDTPQAELDDFKTLLRLSRIAPETWENLHEDGKFGVSRAWLMEAKEYWLNEFDWRDSEQRINSFPNYQVEIPDDEGNDYMIHFVALFSERADAQPIVLLHGWPGSFLEFLEVLEQLRDKYPAADLPYHLIVPSLPGYAYSSGPSLHKHWGCEEMAVIVNKLMIGLGFGSGYVAQGGDIGSRVARILGAEYDACKAVHLNFVHLDKPLKDVSSQQISKLEQAGLVRRQHTIDYGISYARQHGTRSATTGLVLASNPLALLAWIGEKFLEWTDTDPSLDTILTCVTLYWLTETQPRAMYTYVQESGDVPREGEIHGNPKYFVQKPMGFSYFPKELVPVPISWVATTGNLVWHRLHNEGGHFAALEKPALLLKDIEDFVAHVQQL